MPGALIDRRILLMSIVGGVALGLGIAWMLLSGPTQEGAGAAAGATVRYLETRWVASSDAGSSTSTVRVWHDDVNGRSRAEISDSTAALQAIEYRNGSTFTRVLVVDGEPVSATTTTGATASVDGFARQLLRPADIEAGRGAPPDATISADLPQGRLVISTPISRTEVTFDATSGLLQRVARQEIGATERRSTLAILYERDELVNVDATWFEPALPPTVPVYRVAALSAADLTAYQRHGIYGVGDRFGGYRLRSRREEVSPALADRRASRFVQLDYRRAPVKWSR